MKNPLREQGVGAGKPTNSLLTPSSRRLACPICGRTKDGDCRIGTDLVLCHYGSSHHPPEGLRPGDVIDGHDGQRWAFTSDTSDRRAATFALHKPRPQAQRHEPPTKGAESVWRYSDTFLVCRFPGKKIRPLWWSGSRWEWKAPKAPRPLLNLAQLRSNTGTVLIVEGEKAADAAAKLYPRAVVTTWPSGCKAIDKADWSPLVGRRVILWPDADQPGQQAMDRLAQLLLRLPVDRVQMVTPPADVPEGWDLADATWTPEEAAAYIKANISEPLQPQQLPEPATDPEPEPPIVGEYFACLGKDDGDSYYYRPHNTGQIVRLTRSAHSNVNLINLAPQQYWQQLAPGDRGGIDWLKAARTLFEVGASRHVYNPDHIRGRGVWWDGQRTVLHLGERLIVDGQSRPVLEPFDSSFMYQRMAQLKGPADAKPLTDAEAFIIWELADRFHWEIPASGMLFAGWVTLAPICGALPWRPHAWLTASAGSGKSAILDRYVAPLLADMGLIVAGNTTEAGLRQTLRCDALPVVFDEAESNEKSDQIRMQNILSLARVASSESHAIMLKGSPGGDVTRFNIRSMFLMSSIATALKQGADRSRFAQLTLRSPTELPKAERLKHWEALDHDLDRHITNETALRLIARTVSLIPTIRQSIKVFSRTAAEHFDSQRLGDQYGTLMAGAWSLMSSNVPTVDEARNLINQNNWEPYSQATEIPDEQRCIQRILQHQLRVEAENKTCSRAIGELVEIATLQATDRDIEPSMAKSALERHGVKVDQEALSLIVSNTHEAIAHILRDTQWSHSWGTLLARLPGSSRVAPTRFKGTGTLSRAVALQISHL